MKYREPNYEPTCTLGTVSGVTYTLSHDPAQYLPWRCGGVNQGKYFCTMTAAINFFDNLQAKAKKHPRKKGG